MGLKVEFGKNFKMPVEAYKNSKMIDSINVKSTKCPKCGCKSIYIQFLYPIVSYWEAENKWDVHIMMEFEDEFGGKVVQCQCDYCSNTWKSTYSIKYVEE